MASLIPVGLPPESSRRRETNSSSPAGVENDECRAGEMQSTPIGTPRALEISSVTFAPGSTPPWPGLAPWESFTSIIFTWSETAFSANFFSQNRPCASRQPK